MSETKPHGHTGPETLPEVHLTHSPSIGALAAALAKAQSVTESAPKNHTAEVTMKSGGKYRYSYADLAGVWDAGRGPLTSNGLSVVQAPTLTPSGLSMTTLLMHSSGEWCRGELKDFPVPDRTPQGVGTAITYARRYTFGSMVGVVSEQDDDGGNGGVPKTQVTPRETRAETPPAQRQTPPPPAASSGPLPDSFPNFGSQKGKPLAGAQEKDLKWYAKVLRENVADPNKARYKDENAAYLKAIERTLESGSRRGPTDALEEPPPPGDDDAPF